MSFDINIYLILNTVIVGPILEEYLFRGIVYNELLGFNDEKKSLILATIIFSVIHLNIISILYAFIMGLVLNKIYIKYKNINSAIIFHITINLVSSFIFPLIITMI